MKTLVAYFSASGKTKEVAEVLAKKLNGDLFEIVPTEKYSDEDLNWMDSKSRSSIEMKDETSRPSMKNKLNNINDYDTIYLGFPIWWGIAPRIIHTFLESNDFTSKKIITFATSGGSGIGNSTDELRESARGANFVNGKVINVGSIDSFIEEVK